MQLASPDARVGARGAGMGFNSLLALFKKDVLLSSPQKTKKIVNASDVLLLIYIFLAISANV